MEFVDFESLELLREQLRASYLEKKPFHYVMFENFFRKDSADLIYQGYPAIQDGKWDGTTYVDQKNKFQKTKFDTGSTFDRVFKELNSPEFLKWLEFVTGIDNLIGDDELFGGGLHQSTKGAFLNVHVDYNIHPTTKFHRRLNLLVYMNEAWRDEYEGFLELWDLQNGKKELLAEYAPLMNRCVIFETNEISYHGHPKPLKAPADINRKSIAVYYYTREREAVDVAPEHNTIYVNTEGLSGQIKRFSSAIKAGIERIFK